MGADQFYCAATTYHEGRGEPLYGQEGIVHVILNRVIIRKLTVKGVVYEPYQFSCYNANKNPAITNYNAFIIADEIVDKVYTDRVMGFTFYGADHYHATYMDPYPSWAPTMTRVAIVGQHIFYRS